MPTRARRHQLGSSLLYHVYNRCASQGPIFHIEEDFRHFMWLIRKYTEAFHLSVYHWVIMSTHFHLLLQIKEPAEISRFMAGISHAYTRYHHKVYSTRGFLWQGRFKLQPVQKEQYLMACGRYIERNPVRAGIVNEAVEYPWSSARFYCAGLDDGSTSKDPTYARFGRNHSERQSAYKCFLSNFNSQEETLFRKFDKPAGDAFFRSRLRLVNGRQIPLRQGRPRSIIYPQQSACV